MPMGQSFNSFVYASGRTLTCANSTDIWPDVAAFEAGMRKVVCQSSSWIPGSVQPRRTMMRQKEIPTIGPVCKGTREVST